MPTPDSDLIEAAANGSPSPDDQIAEQLRRDPRQPRVTLGEHTYPVYPQRIGYLENRLGKTLATILDSNIDSGASIVQALGSKAYDVLRVFLPRIMPEHEFRGYRDSESYEKREYDPDADVSPTPPEIVTAFEVVMKVNRFDLFEHVGKLIAQAYGLLDKELIGAYLNAQLARRMETTTEGEPDGSGAPLPTGSSTNTPATTSTPSGTPEPTTGTDD